MTLKSNTINSLKMEKQSKCTFAHWCKKALRCKVKGIYTCYKTNKCPFRDFIEDNERDKREVSTMSTSRTYN